MKTSFNLLSSSEDLTAAVLGRSSFISSDYNEMVIPVAGTQTAHTNTHTHTHTHLYKKRKQPSNSRAYFSFRIQAANPGPCGCCLLDISLPKGIYFILPSNPLSSQFSQDHIFFLHPFTSSETFGNLTEDLTTVLSQGDSWFISVPLPPSILCSLERAQFRAGNFAR